MHVTFREFRGRLYSWRELFQQAAVFATDIGKENLISISHSEEAGKGVIAVWYWESGRGRAHPSEREPIS